MSQYDTQIAYIKGDNNMVVDTLSCRPNASIDTMLDMEWRAKNAYTFCVDDTDDNKIASVLPENCSAYWNAAKYLSSLAVDTTEVFDTISSFLTILADKMFLKEIKAGYATDKWVQNTLLKGQYSIPGIQQHDGLWYVGDCLVIPCTGSVHKTLFCLAHDVLGHFGFDKTYAALCGLYYWPNIHKDLETAYVPRCANCQQNKSSTSKPSGPLHPLPVPDACGDSVAINFIGPLPKNNGLDMIVTFTDCLGSDICLYPCNSNIIAPELAKLFFEGWYCENSLPLEIILDHNKLFISAF